MPGFQPGRAIALRDVWRGRIWTARAATVVADVGDQILLFIPAGTLWMAPMSRGRRLKIPQVAFELVERELAEAHILSFGWPGTRYAVLLLFRPDWTPVTWYVNLEEPLRRTEVGFDTLDRQLDVLVAFNGSWRWKDEDELAEAIAGGVTRAQDEALLRAEGERAVARLVDREPPFDRDWTGWRPDPAWSAPRLPPGWDRAPPATV